MTTFFEYQTTASRTFNPNNTPEDNLLNFSLGLAGETGEVIEQVKKHVYHGQPLDQEKFKKELGDVLWYLAGLATVVGADLEEVAINNIKKLKARYPNGFSKDRSVVREGDAE